MKNLKSLSSMILSLIILVVFSSCTPQSKVASANISTAADDFRIERRIVFYNAITGEWIMSMEGFCSIEKDNTDNQLETTCKVGPNEYKKEFFGLSDNTPYFVQQLEIVDVSTYRYKVIFRPATLIPDIDIDVGGKE